MQHTFATGDPSRRGRAAAGRQLIVGRLEVPARQLRADRRDAETTRSGTSHETASRRDVREHVDAIAAEVHTGRRTGTYDFAFMFIPVEGLYYELACDETRARRSTTRTRGASSSSSPTTLSRSCRRSRSAWREDADRRERARGRWRSAAELSTASPASRTTSTSSARIDRRGQAYNESASSLEPAGLVTARKFEHGVGQPSEVARRAAASGASTPGRRRRRAAAARDRRRLETPGNVCRPARVQ